MSILDDFKDLDPQKEKYVGPNKWLARGCLAAAVFILIGMVYFGLTSETALVEFSYIYMPLFFTGIFSFFMRPKKAIGWGVLSIVFIFLFYVVIFPAL